MAGMGLSAVVACSSEHGDGQGDEKRMGTLSLALQATAPSGTVYRLRNAFFQIVSLGSGETVDFLTSENGLPEAGELTTILDSGQYTVTLQPGWFLERLGSGPPQGGTAGESVGGSGPIGFGGTFSSAGSAPIPALGGAFGSDDVAKLPFPVALGFGGEGPGSFGGEGPGSSGGTGPIPTEGGSGPIPTEGGAFGEGGSFGGGGQIVRDAQLLSSPLQFFALFGGDEAFVNYQFQVGGEVIDFGKGRLHIGFGVDEVTSCEVPDGVLMPERVLLETNVDAVSNVSLFGALNALASNGGRNDDPIALYQQIYDSYASADQAVLPDAVHCGDETTNAQPSLNGYPIDCDRSERFQIDNLFSFFPTAFVNRIDLAPENGAHCGQQRIIFANNALNRAFMIVEAQIPNPAPELGIEGCRPLAEFWLAQNAIDDPTERGQRLARAFLSGDPDLLSAGFGPFYSAENLTVGSGQIRTNQFDQDPWTLREFKLALDQDGLRAIPFPVAEAPHGGLWDENEPLPAGASCRENFLTALQGLLTDDLSRMSFVVDGACKDAESRNDFSQDYASRLSAGFREDIEARLLGTGLTADDIANRAQFAGSCIGCHNEASGRSLGNGVFAPFSGDFVQVSEFSDRCGGGETGSCFPPSSALTSVFLPGRLQVMSSLLGIPLLPNPCSGGGGGVGGAPGMGGFGAGGGGPIGTAGTSFGGSFGTAGSSSSHPGNGGRPAVAPDVAPAPVVDIELAEASEPIEVLEEQDAEIRQAYGERTLSGRSAKVTH